MNNILEPQNNFTWPPQYSLRQSPRAKRVSLHFNARGLEIVVPKRFNIKRVPDILTEHRQWIERTQQRFQSITPKVKDEELPQQLKLLAINQEWNIQYQPTDRKFLYLKVVEQGALLISGDINNKSAVQKILLRWLKKQAQLHLMPWLKIISDQCGLPYESATIRNSQTRWGSCSSKKKITLSSHLLFIAPELVEHIMVHELCHTRHLNHSKRFWDLFEKLNPNCKEFRKQLCLAQYALPGWLVMDM